MLLLLEKEIDVKCQEFWYILGFLPGEIPIHYYIAYGVMQNTKCLVVLLQENHLEGDCSLFFTQFSGSQDQQLQ